ncbi:hypothetical protein KAR91_48805 [Candidatus Pacearchaeota archaeon]|nr:hypothetical protein [Candidatus Pacearchaeota archaeon]
MADLSKVNKKDLALAVHFFRAHLIGKGLDTEGIKTMATNLGVIKELEEVAEVIPKVQVLIKGIVAPKKKDK